MHKTNKIVLQTSKWTRFSEVNKFKVWDIAVLTIVENVKLLARIKLLVESRREKMDE